MNSKLQEVRKAMSSFLSEWSQGLKDCGLFDQACAAENSLIDLETAIERKSEETST